MEALTIKTFKTNKISTAEVSEKDSKEYNYKSVEIAYDGAEVPPIRVDGIFRINKHFKNNNVPVYHLAIECTGANESFFRKLNSVLAKKTCEIFKDDTITPEDFELISETKYGRYVFVKIYLKRSEKVKCRISKGSYKNLIEIDELVDEDFRGSYILKIHQAYIGSRKDMSLMVKEILVREFIMSESYFANESD